MLSRPSYMRSLFGAVGIISVWILVNQRTWQGESPLASGRYFRAFHGTQTFTNQVTTPKNYTLSLVVASTSSENTSWVFDKYMPPLEPFIYVADDLSAPRHPPQNKGHETMMYLTHIIDHYDNLTDIVTFTHAERFAWHNNDLLDMDTVEMLRRLRLEHVVDVGYFNLRCHPDLGCPVEPLATMGYFMPDRNVMIETWEELHGPDAPAIPFSMSTACCAQFAVTKQAIQRVGRERWIRWRDWLLNTDLHDDVSGRIWEYTWHYVLSGGETPVLCPDLQHCYCHAYGLCFDSNADIDALLGIREAMFLAEWRAEDLNEEYLELADPLLSEGGVPGGERFHIREKLEKTMFHLNAKLRRVYDYRIRTAIVRGKELFEGYGALYGA